MEAQTRPIISIARAALAARAIRLSSVDGLLQNLVYITDFLLYQGLGDF